MPAALRTAITVRHFGDRFGTKAPLEHLREFEFGFGFEQR